jgi:hypothetical protein
VTAIELGSWVMCVWSVLTRWLLAEQRYVLGWWVCLSSQVGWGLLSYYSGLPGMLAFSFISLGVALRALYRLRTQDTAQK